MAALVIILNVLISIACWFVAWKIWRLRLTLASVANTLERAERSTHSVLYGAPRAIIRGQSGTRGLRQRYQVLDRQVEQLRRLIAIATFGLGVWQRQVKPSRRPKRRSH
ncbi:hypothetical protein H6G20_20145 [Desertifilum sp. FACHB-1129]|uniref:Uncharacterized protein n=1 Tax=Desertifilum tharense IPPAS B-1220 TaxID=1781255 RepID=A0A1E5QHU5_9CYAN|nr:MULTISPECIES: hypothetical protein [Desertifilum]MDA0211349.1 hypothetical protein [Cyanobacteria bacterium FC1]MBD2313984.1 hypothetical protein [Desertifilum sp. FACHB-1129]MBD2320310.1 hypothetical protein [Desertifilum sp. FACHB-866]MBD2330438.1 hypothetical protein [Desertifilum sp. FACHB-868]OEJ74249.1 hypothetical protein BH720_15725 [Desertifilum tharense IPPAS B-1220]